jgi:hypothetical protein
VLRITNVPLTDGCMAVPGGSMDVGTQLIARGCGNWADHPCTGQANQQWSFEYWSDDWTYPTYWYLYDY